MYASWVAALWGAGGTVAFEGTESDRDLVEAVRNAQIPTSAGFHGAEGLKRLWFWHTGIDTVYYE